MVGSVAKTGSSTRPSLAHVALVLISGRLSLLMTWHTTERSHPWNTQERRKGLFRSPVQTGRSFDLIRGLARARRLASGERLFEPDCLAPRHGFEPRFTAPDSAENTQCSKGAARHQSVESSSAEWLPPRVRISNSTRESTRGAPGIGGDELGCGGRVRVEWPKN